MTRIAVLGLGAMGSRIAARLLDAGHNVTVFNRTAERARPLIEKGAIRADTPRAAAREADLVIAMVTDDEASRALWLNEETGALQSLSPQTVAIESSTLTPAWVRELNERVSARGAAFLDAPVAGSRPQAEAGQLIYFVGGDAAVLERVSETLMTLGSAIHHIGPAGSGATFKLAVNALFGIQTAALGEILGLLEKQGMEITHCVDWLNALPTTSPAMKIMGQLMASHTFAPLFPIDLVEKDFGYLTSLTESAATRTPLSAAARAVYRQAVERSLGNANISRVVQLYTTQ